MAINPSTRKALVPTEPSDEYVWVGGGAGCTTITSGNLRNRTHPVPLVKRPLLSSIVTPGPVITPVPEFVTTTPVMPQTEWPFPCTATMMETRSDSEVGVLPNGPLPPNPHDGPATEPLRRTKSSKNRSSLAIQLPTEAERDSCDAGPSWVKRNVRRTPYPDECENDVSETQPLKNDDEDNVAEDCSKDEDA